LVIAVSSAVKATVEIRITAAETKLIRAAKIKRTNYKRNEDVSKKLKTKPILDSIFKYEHNWIEHDERTQRDRLPRRLKNGKREDENHRATFKQTLEILSVAQDNN
jgi:hypothetical protein